MTFRDFASSALSFSFSRSSALTLSRSGLVFGPRLRESASVLCWSITRLHSVIWDEKSPSLHRSAPFCP